MNGVVYAKGLGTHAASDVRYTLAGTCSLFTATVGVDDEVGANGSVVFQVFTDGTKVYDSGVLTGSSPSAAVSLDVTGKTALQLVVTNGGDNIDYDHADWADASLTCGSTNSGGAPSFAPAVSLPAAIHTHGVAMVDLNADGKLDLVAANAGSSTASVWLGNGNGTFGARADFPTGLTPKMVAVGDLNGDGKKDLVSANQDAATVSVLLGNGAGGFAAKVDYAACTGTHEVALGDLNGDGAPDIIAACWGGSVVSVLLGNGDGTLRPKVDYGAGAAPHSVVLGRFDGDAFLDAAVANHDSNTVSILRGNGDGTFQAQITYAVGTGPHSLRSGDLNGDGSLDLVTANETSSDVSVLLGNGNGTFETAVNYPTGSVPKGVAIADVSGDGRADVITADTAGSYPVCCNPGGNLISVLLGSGAGTLGAPIPFTVGQTPFAVATGDLDGDGDLDVATANWDSGDVTVLKNLTAASADTTPPTVTGTSPANGATGVATSITPSATFSEAIDPTTVSTTTMTLTNQATSAAVAGSVAYNGTSHTATFSPSAALAAGTTYLARLKGGSSGVKDLAGNALAADATWTFTTAAGVAASQVRIETAANGTGTVVPAQSLAVGSAITGYAISRDSTGGFIANVPASWSLTALSGGVVGTDLVVAGDAKSATFTGHAAGSAIIHPVVSGLTSVDSGTISVTAGSTTSYLSDLAYSAVANGWGPVEKDTSNGEQAAGDGAADHLERGRLRQGPGHPRRVGRALHAGRHVQPVHGHGRRRRRGRRQRLGRLPGLHRRYKVYDSGVLTGSSPSAAVSLDVTGKTALQLVVTNGGDNIDYDHADWADAKLTCGSTADTTPPTVTGTSPANGATGVATSITPSATFSEAIDPTTVSTTTMTLTNQATSAAVAGSVAYNGTSHTRDLQPERGAGRRHDLPGPAQGWLIRGQGPRRQRPGRRRDLDVHDGHAPTPPRPR